MENLIYLTILGSIFTLILVGFKSSLIKKYGGSWYYYIWILVLISFCLPYKYDILQSLQYKPQIAQQTTDNYETMFEPQNMFPNLAENNNLMSQNNTVLNNVLETTQPLPIFSVEQILHTIYFVGFFAFLMYYIMSYVAFKRNLLRTTSIAANERYLNCLADVCDHMGISKSITLKESSLTISPMFIGILKPIIILPVKNFTDIDLYMIFKHELTHYKRRDMVYRLLALLVTLIHWFNPIAYLALRSINEACEYSCDEAVTKQMDTERRKEYGCMLLNQIKTNNKTPLFLAGFAEDNQNKNVLERRLNIIMSTKKYKWIGITFVSVLALVVCANLFEFKAINSEDMKNNSESDKIVGEESINSSSPIALDKSATEYTDVHTKNTPVQTNLFTGHDVLTESLVQKVNEKHFYSTFSKPLISASDNINISLEHYFITNETMAFEFKMEGISDDLPKDYVQIEYKVYDGEQNLIYDFAGDDGNIRSFPLSGLGKSCHDLRGKTTLEKNSDGSYCILISILPNDTENDMNTNTISVPDKIVIKMDKISYFPQSVMDDYENATNIGRAYVTPSANSGESPTSEFVILPEPFVFKSEDKTVIKGKWNFEFQVDNMFKNLNPVYYDVVNKSFAEEHGIYIDKFYTTVTAGHMDITIDTNSRRFSETTMAIWVDGEDIIATGWTDTLPVKTDNGMKYSVYLPTLYFSDKDTIQIQFLEKDGNILNIDLKKGHVKYT